MSEDVHGASRTVFGNRKNRRRVVSSTLSRLQHALMQNSLSPPCAKVGAREEAREEECEKVGGRRADRYRFN